MPVIEFTDPVSQNPYLDEAQELLNAGEGKGYALTVEFDPDAKGEPGAKDRIKFQKAANELGFTARFRYAEVDENNDTVTMVFTASPRHKARRGKADDAA